METIQEKQAQVIQDFQKFSDWESRYKHLIEYGKNLPAMPESMKSEETKVKGCQSQVWLYAELTPEKRIRFHADSDALIVKGLAAVLLKVYDQSTPEEILMTPPEFIRQIGFEGNLSPSRTNGLFSMLKQIRLYATAFSMLQKSK